MNLSDLLNWLIRYKVINTTEKSDIEIKFQTFINFLMAESIKFNLIGKVDEQEIIENHIFDSVQILKYDALTNCRSCCDIGTGAGFPGLILAILKPHIKFTLLEANNKKVRFLNTIIDILKIHNVDVVWNRAETWAHTHAETFDYVISRAVGQIAIIAELSAQQLKLMGSLILWKGPKLQDELRNADAQLLSLGLGVSKIIPYGLATNNQRQFLVLQKHNHTPMKFPRSFNQIKKSWK